MPGGDRTGPMGAGPMTGRGAGFCAGYSAPGFVNPVGGRGYAGFGRGFGGGGRGQRNRYFATGAPLWARVGYLGTPAPATYPPVTISEEEALKQQAQYLNNTLDAIKQRIDELKQNASQ